MTENPPLFHASTNSRIEIFEPREESPRYPNEGPLVFATPDKRVAAMFLAPKNGGTAEICKFDDEVIFVVQNNPEGFIAKDKGGAIYTLPSDTFTTDPTLGMGATEWISKKPVAPISKEIYDTSLQAMRKMGVKVYFVNKDSMNRIREADDHGLGILRTFRPYLG